MVPILGCSLGSTTKVREVPSALGLPGQSAADAGVAATLALRIPERAKATRSTGCILNAVPIHNPIRSNKGGKTTGAAMKAALITLCRRRHVRGGRNCGRSWLSREDMHHAKVVVLQVTQKIRQHGGGLRLRIMQQ